MDDGLIRSDNIDEYAANVSLHVAELKTAQTECRSQKLSEVEIQAEAETPGLPQTPPGSELTAKPAFAAADAWGWAPSWLRGQRWELLNKELNDVPLIKIFVDHLAVAPVVVGFAGLVLAVAFLLYGVGGQVVCTIIGVAWPAYESFKAVEEFANLQDPDKDALYKQAAALQFWLSYWIVCAAITTAECMLYYLLVLIPFYYPMKALMLVYMFLPQTRGANRVYNWFVLPYLKRHQATIDSTLQESGAKIRKSVRTLSETAVGAGVGISKEGVKRIRRAGSAVGPCFEAAKKLVGAELSRRMPAENATAD
eukprot:TRINITY_DN4715_c0_g1_i1.p1 TRINITY_DN4715_c0_g1~~TRINITY_DN4715_c0_g1_i1.p1  ORF type:complete len:310 (-),score=49.02 TRINITY_DN4715_c0_g1_i1:183-1112(-)